MLHDLRTQNGPTDLINPAAMRVATVAFCVFHLTLLLRYGEAIALTENRQTVAAGLVTISSTLRAGARLGPARVFRHAALRLIKLDCELVLRRRLVLRDCELPLIILRRGGNSGRVHLLRLLRLQRRGRRPNPSLLAVLRAERRTVAPD